MIDEYVVNNKLYLKDSTSIECTEFFKNKLTWSGNHFWVTISNFIELDFIDRNQIIFLAGDKLLIYWCDVNIFLDLHCYKKSEIRELKLNEIGI